jgi:hypothetical protein
MVKTTLVTALGVLSAFSMMVGPAQTAGVADAETLNCVDLMRIDHTQVVDEQNILFYMRNGSVYLNRLSHRAPGLDRNRPFMYRTSIGRLCNHDTITVLETWGFGFTQGASSALGRFVLTDEAGVDALKSGQPAGVEIEPIGED